MSYFGLFFKSLEGSEAISKYLVIYKNKDKYPITIMCKFFVVSRSGYYGYLNRLGSSDKDEPMAARLKTIAEARAFIDDYIHFYNYERIQLKMKLTPYQKRCQFA